MLDLHSVSAQVDIDRQMELAREREMSMEEKRTDEEGDDDVQIVPAEEAKSVCSRVCVPVYVCTSAVVHISVCGGCTMSQDSRPLYAAQSECYLFVRYCVSSDESFMLL